MKKTVPFEIFGPNQYLMFDIKRLAALERAIGKPIATIIAEQSIGIDFALKALPIAMQDHYHNPTPDFFAEKIEKYLDEGGAFDQIGVPLVQAILISGFLGSEVRDRVMEQLKKQAEEPEKNAERTNSPS